VDGVVSVGELAFVFGAGLVTALATGLGAVPFFLFDDISERWNVALWGVASGIMLAASAFGLIAEGLAATTGFPTLLLIGIGVGVVLVVVSDALLDRLDFDGASAGETTGVSRTDGNNASHRPDGGQPTVDSPGESTAEPSEAGDEPLVSAAVADSDLRTLVLILGILTVHSFPEGVAIGVSFADLGLAGGVELFGLAVPVLAVFMTMAISIHNVPEGVAISIPLRSMGVGEWRMVGAAVASSLPQPVGAVVAFAFVEWAHAFLPFGFGFAAGAMVYLVFAEFVPEALELGEALDGGGYRELTAGAVGGVLLMLPLLLA
jgi:ZIP family zinc transporter